MNRSEIRALDNEALVGHLMSIEADCVKEENSRRGVSKKTKKDYMWTVEEVASRFSLDLPKLIEQTGSAHWWEQNA